MSSPDVPRPTASPDREPKRSSTVAWVLYDMANTVFSFNIVSVYFALWLNQDLGLKDSFFAIGNSTAMAVIFFLAPVLGTLSDKARRRVPFLVASTVVCVGATAWLGVFGWQAAILLFVLANIGFQSGLIFYDALLPTVSRPETRGRVAATGVGVGYMGSFVGLTVGRLILSGDETRDAWVFVATAVLFLMLALPAFFLIKEPAKQTPRLGARQVAAGAREAYQGLWRVARGADIPHVRRFLFGRILYTDAVNTMILFMGIYAANEAGFTEAEVPGILLAGIIGAAVMSFGWGVVVDRIGPKHTLDVVLLLWMFCLTMVILVAVLALPKATFYPLAFIIGGALGGTWSSDRPLMLGLVPAERVGEFYGYYAMVGRFAAVFGPLVWAGAVDGLGFGRPAAVGLLSLFILAAFMVLRPLPDPYRPGPTGLWPYLPWRRDDGRPRPPHRAGLLQAPATTLYLIGASSIYVLYDAWYDQQFRLLPDWVDRWVVHRADDLLHDGWGVVAHFATSVWFNVHVIQFAYVVVLLILFGAWFERHEGPARTAFVFYASSIAAGIVGGFLIMAVDGFYANDWTAYEADRLWVGGSAGAMGLMGGIAARARRPWLLLAGFTFWELNLGIWWLQSSTPFYHLTALVTGFLLTRYSRIMRAPRALA